MSIRLMSEIWDDESELKATTLLVALALADHANDQGCCWPHVETLAARARCSERQAYRALDELETAGVLIVPEGERTEERPFIVGRQNVMRQNVMRHPGQVDPDTHVTDDLTPMSGPYVEAPKGTINEPPALFGAPALNKVEQRKADRAELWAHFQATVRNGSRKHLDTRRKRIVDRALDVRSLDECKFAVARLAESSFHNGRNDRQTEYLDIQYALGKASDSPDAVIDKWLSEKPRAGARTTVDELLDTFPADVRSTVVTRMRSVVKGYSSQSPPIVEQGQIDEKRLRETFHIVPIVENGRVTGWKKEEQ